MWATATAFLLVGQVAAIPTYFDERHSGCAIPDMQFKGHGAPAPADVEFVFASADGDPVQAWVAGETYTVTIPTYPGATPASVNVWMHMTDGAPDVGAGALAASCTGTEAAWYSTDKAAEHMITWVAPAAGAAGTCVTFSVAQATGPTDAYKTNTADFCAGDGVSTDADAPGPAVSVADVPGSSIPDAPDASETPVDVPVEVPTSGHQSLELVSSALLAVLVMMGVLV